MPSALAVVALALIALLGVVPALICGAYTTGWFGSVGPWVPLWGVLVLFLAPPAIYLPLSELLHSAWQRLLLAVASLALGVLVAVTAANSVMLFSYLFGIYDYAQG